MRSDWIHGKHIPTGGSAVENMAGTWPEKREEEKPMLETETKFASWADHEKLAHHYQALGRKEIYLFRLRWAEGQGRGST